MRKLLTLLLISYTMFASAQTGSFPIDGKTISYTSASVVTNTVKYSDGTVLTITGSVAKSVVTKAYKDYLLSHPTWILVGTGSGRLDLGVLANKKFKIKPGNYWSIGFTSATNVVIDATGVTINSDYSSFDINNANNFELYGLTMADQSYRAVNIRGFCTGIYLHDLTFKNIKSNVITYEYAGIWDGTDKTNSKDWRIENCSFTNVGQGIGLGGGYSDGGITTYMSGIKILNNKFVDCPTIGTVMYASALDGYEIAGNVVNNINNVYDKSAPNGIHNGIFMITGNGSFHDNKITNHQGNAIRAWGVSFGSTVKDIKIYNNIVYNSWKYSAFELQAPQHIVDFLTSHKGVINYTDAYVYNNTAGHLTISKDWEGVMLDTYNTGGKISYYNNFGFDMYRPANAIGNMTNSNGGNIVKDSGNLYLNTWQEAVTDLTTFKSKFVGVGAQ